MSQATDTSDELAALDDAPAEVSVADPEEYSQSRRLKAIHDARENVLGTRDRLLEAQFGRQGLSDQRARRYFRQSVENYILEVEPLLTSEDVECAPDYWEEVDLGAFQIPAPPELTTRPDDPQTHVVDGTELPSAKRVELTGLKSIIETDWPTTATFQLTLDVKHAGMQTVSRSVSSEPTMDILLAAYRTTNQFLRDVEIDATLDTTDDEFHADYSDILDDDEDDPRDVAGGDSE